MTGSTDGSGSVGGILLAAGGGTRFGGPKALVRYRGELLVERGVRLLVDGGCGPVVAVLGAAADQVEVAADLSDTVVVDNADWVTGMGGSLRAGLVALARQLPSPDRAAAVIALVDQPLVSAEAVQRLVDAWRAGAVAAVATYGGVPGHPVLFDRSVWGDVLARATGDRGARDFLRMRADIVQRVACDGTGFLDDIDTRDDLERLEENARCN